MNDLAEFVYNAISYRLEVPKEEFLEQLKEWELHPIYLAGKIGAVVMIQGTEIHVASAEEGRGKWLSRGFIKDTLGGIIRKHGFATTRTEYDNAPARAFVERLGFVPDTVFYRLDKLKHVKEQVCQSEQ
jgi:GNAT superfamily N-acetyltransferase